MQEKTLVKTFLYREKLRLNNFTPKLSVTSTMFQLWIIFKTFYQYSANARIFFLNHDSLYLLRKCTRPKIL